MSNLNMNLPYDVMRLSVKVSFFWNKYSTGFLYLAHKPFVSCVTHLLVKPTKCHKKGANKWLSLNWLLFSAIIIVKNCNGIGMFRFELIFTVCILWYSQLTVTDSQTLQKSTDACRQHCQEPKTASEGQILLIYSLIRSSKKVEQSSGCV